MASRISRKVCTLGRPGALGTGRWGSIQDHSASDKSVWYALLMLGTLPSHLLKAPFRTVSPRTRLNRGHEGESKDTDSTCELLGGQLLDFSTEGMRPKAVHAAL